MKKLITILISSSLLTAGAIAQQDDAQPTPKKKQHEKGQTAREASPPGGEQAPAQPRHRGHRGMNPRKQQDTAPANDNATGNTQSEQRNTNRNPNRKSARTDKAASPAPAATQARGQASEATQAPTAPQAGQPNERANQPNQQGNRRNAKAKKPDPETVQRVKTQHANFHAQPKPQQVPSVTFNESYRINGSQNWQGERYNAFRSYRPQRHDRNWWHSNFNTIVLIGGGYYYWNGGCWYPAWGYSPSEQYYAYDGPIYTGSASLPPDQVIANVQAVLQEQGYYRGEVDGLLGPLTREALTAYQNDNGLYATAAIDQPTLESLGMGS